MKAFQWDAYRPFANHMLQPPDVSTGGIGVGGSSNEQAGTGRDGHQMSLVGEGWGPMFDVHGGEGYTVKSNASWAMGTQMPL